MNILILLIGISLVVALVFLGAFLWSVRNGQFEDTHTPGMRILLDEKHGYTAPTDRGDHAGPTQGA